jgi:hypothetical protein
MTTQAKRVVKVWDKDCEITVYQKSKAVWIAVGDCQNERLEVKGRSERDATSRWREAARYKTG